MAERSIAIRRTTFYVIPGLSTSSSSSSSLASPTSSSQETVTPTEHPASARSESMSEEVRGDSSRTVWLMNVFQNTQTLPVLLMNYLQRCEQKWYRVSTAFLHTSRRTEIAISVWEPRLQGFLAEDALLRSCPERTILVTWWLRITKFYVKDVNLETIIDTL